MAEVMVAILILSMMTAIVAGGIPVAVNAYNKVVDAANAQTLLSTSLSALRNELSTARDIRIADDRLSVTYYSSGRGVDSRIYIEDGRIVIKEYPSVASRPLVSDAAATGTLKVSYGTLTYSEATGIFTLSGVTVKKGETVLASQSEYEIRVIA